MTKISDTIPSVSKLGQGWLRKIDCVINMYYMHQMTLSVSYKIKWSESDILHDFCGVFFYL